MKMTLTIVHVDDASCKERIHRKPTNASQPNEKLSKSTKNSDSIYTLTVIGAINKEKNDNRLEQFAKISLKFVSREQRKFYDKIN